jgi:hypothetical protein
MQQLNLQFYTTKQQIKTRVNNFSFLISKYLYQQSLGVQDIPEKNKEYTTTLAATTTMVCQLNTPNCQNTKKQRSPISAKQTNR